MSRTSHLSSEEYDLVVLGSGIAGLVTAVTAVELGLRVLVLEKTDRIGGSSAMSGGWFAFTGTDEQSAAGVVDSPASFEADLLSIGGGRNHLHLISAYLQHQEDTYRWLKGRGVIFDDLEVSSGQSVARSHHSRITTVLDDLFQSFHAGGGHIRFEHRATSLVCGAGNRVVAVAVESPGARHHVGATRGVVVATGGFTRSPDLLSVFAPDQLQAIPYGGPANTGDGLRMGWRLGAGMADMSCVSGTFGSHPDTTEAFHELLTAYYSGAVIVNALGRRFVDESLDYKSLGRAVLSQPGGLAFQVFDSRVRATSRRGVALKDIETLEDLGHIHRADSLQELAITAGIDADALTSTVADYNAAVAGRQPDDQGRTSLCHGAGTPEPINAAPFYAYPCKTLLTSTYSGLTTDERGQVLDVDGGVIAGLYAVGEVTGGFHGSGYMTGTSLGKGAVFGRLAARHAALQLAPPGSASDSEGETS